MQETPNPARGDVPPLVPVPNWPDYFIWPTVAALRWYIFNAEHNGFNRVIKRCGKRILLCPKEFAAWVDQRNADHG